MSDILEYKKISQLPAATAVGDNDIFVMNANGKTCKVSLSTIVSYVVSQINLNAVEQRLKGVEDSVTNLSNTVAENSGSIDNIIAAGFNLIGIDA